MAVRSPENTFIQFARDAWERPTKSLLLIIQPDFQTEPITDFFVVRMASSGWEVAFPWVKDGKGGFETTPIPILWATETLQDMGWILLASADHYMIWQASTPEHPQE